MYKVIGDPGGLVLSYDNITKQYQTINRSVLVAVASHTLRLASKATRPCSPTSTKLKRRHDRYLDLDDESELPSTAPHILHPYYNDATHIHNGWRRRLKIASLGHIVVGWASRLISVTSDIVV